MGVRGWWHEITTMREGISPPAAMAAPSFDSSGRPVVNYTPRAVELLRLAGGMQSYAHLYDSQPAVRICVNFLARNIAHLNLRTYRKDPVTGEVEFLRGHPLDNLLQRPNERTVRYDFVRDLVSDIGIYDNAYVLKRFTSRGNDRRLYRLPAALVVPKGGNIITGPREYEITMPGDRKAKTFRPDEVIHLHGYHPTDTRVGTSPLEALRSILVEEIEASRWREKFWRNSAKRDGVIERPPSNKETGVPRWSDEHRERFRKEWNDRFARGSEAGSTPLLEDGMKWNPDSFSPHDAEFIVGREFSLDTAATAYQIPLAVLSRKGTATFASMREFRTMLYVDTLGPWNAQIEGGLWLQLIPEFDDPDLYVEFNIEEKLQGDFESQANALRAGGHVPYLSVNDMRRLRGLPRIDDLAFDVPARPQSYAYAGDPTDTPDAAEATDPRRLAPAAGPVAGPNEMSLADELEAELQALLNDRPTDDDALDALADDVMGE